MNPLLAPPSFRVKLAERAGLIELLRRGADRRLVLVDAPAGYGKTCLLAQRHAQLRADGAIVVWLGIDQADAERLLLLLVEGLAQAGLELGQLETLAGQGFTDVAPSSAVRLLIEALAGSTAPIVLMIDDVHRISPEAAREVLTPLIMGAPASTRFHCGGCDSSALPKALLRARGDLLEIGVGDLRFSYAEARTLFPQLDQPSLEQLLTRTEGWPVALQLARLWLEATPDRVSMLNTFSGSTAEVAEYLTERLLSGLPESLRTVLSEISLLDTCNAELAAALTGNDRAWGTLIGEGQLEHFMIPLDGDHYWFRLHGLLLDYLRSQRRAQGGGDRALHLRAAAWFEQRDNVRDAVRHAVLAGDTAHAAALIERAGGWELALFGGTSLMRELLQMFPRGQLSRFPRVQLVRAYVAAKAGDIARAQRLYAEIAAHGGAADGALERDLMVIGYLLSSYVDRPVLSEELDKLHAQFDALPITDDNARAVLLNSAVSMSQRLGQMSNALAACRRAVSEMQRIGSTLGLNYCLIHQGLVQFHLGERREAEASWLEAATMADENFGSDSGLKGIADAHLALALAARGDIDGSTERLEPYLASVETTDGWIDLYAEAYETTIGNAMARADTAAAKRAIEHMSRTAGKRGFESLARLATAFGAQTSILTAMRERSRNASPATRTKPSTPSLDEWQADRWRNQPSAWREHFAFGVLHVLEALFSGNLAAAPLILQDLETAARAGDRLRHLRMIGALRATVQVRMGEPEAGMAIFAPILQTAVDEDDTQFLVGHGPALMPLLQLARSNWRQRSGSARAQLALNTALGTLARQAGPADAADTLTARELEVLLELEKGAPNKVIARSLQMTENTVKFHLKRIFLKLKVRHRAEALHVVRTRGLLP